MNSAAETCQLKEGEMTKSREHPASDISWTSPKRWFDLSLASLLLIPGLPLIGLLVLLVRLTSKGPGIYRQVRVGLNGENFTLFKLRSMRVDAEARSGAVWCSGKSDSRVTPLGKLLRDLHLDELPQLFNVIKGEMSLVGPRPERPEITPVLEENIPRYRERIDVLPGVTGFAQLNLPPDTDLDSVRRKLVLDLEYIQKRNMWFDLRILLCTFRSFLFINGTWLLKLFGVYQAVSESQVKELYFHQETGSGVDSQTAGGRMGSEPVPANDQEPALSKQVVDRSRVSRSSGKGAVIKASGGQRINPLDSSIIVLEKSSDDLPKHPR